MLGTAMEDAFGRPLPPAVEDDLAESEPVSCMQSHPGTHSCVASRMLHLRGAQVTDMRGCDLSGTSFAYSYLRGAIFRDATLTAARFAEACRAQLLESV